MLHAFIDFQQNWNMRDNDWLGESYKQNSHVFVTLFK